MDTKSLQQRLNRLGYNTGGVDGVFGRMTRKAVADFQADHQVHVQWPGTVGPKTIEALNGLSLDAEPLTGSLPPPWYLEAKRKIGLQESLNNKALRDYLKSDGATLGDPAKLPWCGDLMETVLALSLPEEPLPANPYWALNWKAFGRPIDIVALGAIAPFSRAGGGHIGQIAGHDKTHFHVLGGNQSNAITIARIEKDRLAGSLRWPLTYPLPTDALPLTTIDATVSTNEA